MLRLSATLMHQPIISLRSGGQIALATGPVINPHNLKIVGWWVREKGNPRPLILLVEDVRQLGPEGIAVDDESDLCLVEELVRHKEIIAAHFQLIDKPVKTKRQKLGKVSDYIYNDGMFIQKLYVSRPMVKILSPDDTLVIDRNQILEVTDRYILVKDTEVTEGATERMPAAEALPAS